MVPRRYLSLACFLMLSVVPIVAQEGEIKGHVEDAQGAVFANVKVMLVDLHTLVTFYATTSSQGEFTFSVVGPRKYLVIAAEQNGCALVAMKAFEWPKESKHIKLVLRQGKGCKTIS